MNKNFLSKSQNRVPPRMGDKSVKNTLRPIIRSTEYTQKMS